MYIHWVEETFIRRESNFYEVIASDISEAIALVKSTPVDKYHQLQVIGDKLITADIEYTEHICTPPTIIEYRKNNKKPKYRVITEYPGQDLTEIFVSTKTIAIAFAQHKSEQGYTAHVYRIEYGTSNQTYITSRGPFSNGYAIDHSKD